MLLPYSEEPSDPWVEFVEETSHKRLRAAPHVLRSLQVAGFPSQSRRAEYCGWYWAEYEGKEGKILRDLHCHSRYCPACSREHTSRILTKIRLQERKIASAVSTLITFTAGRTVEAEELSNRVQLLKMLFRQWRRSEAKYHGLQGGWYAFEVTYTEDQLYHAHMHIYARYSPSAGWLLKDRSYMKRWKPRPLEWTPAYLHVHQTWLETMHREAPLSYEDLPDLKLEEEWKETELRGVAEWLNIEFRHKKYVSCDIGGRYPSGKEPHKPVGSVDDSAKEVILKYVSKNMRDSNTQGNPLYLVPIIRAFHRVRRCQGFGDLYGVPISHDEILAEIERATGEEMRESLTDPHYTARIITPLEITDPVGFGIDQYLPQFTKEKYIHVDYRSENRLLFIHTGKDKCL